MKTVSFCALPYLQFLRITKEKVPTHVYVSSTDATNTRVFIQEEGMEKVTR
jgi:capsular polysaccharide biosynthesis protein